MVPSLLDNVLYTGISVPCSSGLLRGKIGEMGMGNVALICSDGLEWSDGIKGGSWWEWGYANV